MIDLLVLGSGVAGLSAALRAAVAGLRVVVVTKGEIGLSATRYAQGGVAAALSHDDSPELHLSDTLAAGGGLCDSVAARILVDEGPSRVRELIEAGAVFDVTGDGEAAALALAREGGHSLPRVIHAGGDATGAEIERALVAGLDATEVEVREGWFAVDILTRDGRCEGVWARDPRGRPVELAARATIVASGGAGQLYSVTTNPLPSTGDGTAMALRAGVAVADLEFVQFHPTALHLDAMPRPLLSEALRGEGAVLRDHAGTQFMAGEHPLADLAPRDVVARALARRIHDQGVDHLWLDATPVHQFPERFPTIYRSCRSAGLDPTRDWLPVAPAAHYLCGGIVTDLEGATTMPGLFAVGEAACTGVHGANRLASNSLLEGLVFAPRAVEAAIRGQSGPRPTGAMDGVIPPPHTSVRSRRIEPSRSDLDAAGGRPHDPAGRLRGRLQRAMTSGAGVVRTGASLGEAQAVAETVVAHSSAWEIDDLEVENLAETGRALCRSAMARRESRGAHGREEFPQASGEFLGRFVHQGSDRLEFVPRAEARAPAR